MSEEESKVIQEEAEEVDEDAAAMPPPPEKAIDIEKAEEQKLKSKFPGKLSPLHLYPPSHYQVSRSITHDMLHCSHWRQTRGRGTVSIPAEETGQGNEVF